MGTRVDENSQGCRGETYAVDCGIDDFNRIYTGCLFLSFAFDNFILSTQSFNGAVKTAKEDRTEKR